MIAKTNNSLNSLSQPTKQSNTHLSLMVIGRNLSKVKENICSKNKKKKRNGFCPYNYISREKILFEKTELFSKKKIINKWTSERIRKLPFAMIFTVWKQTEEKKHTINSKCSFWNLKRFSYKIRANCWQAKQSKWWNQIKNDARLSERKNSMPCCGKKILVNQIINV